jgi:hypothetical protein
VPVLCCAKHRLTPHTGRDDFVDVFGAEGFTQVIDQRRDNGHLLPHPALRLVTVFRAHRLSFIISFTQTLNTLNTPSTRLHPYSYWVC